MALPGWKDKTLFTPGPLTTSRTVKQAMLRDLGSRDGEFIAVIKDIRRRLVALATRQVADYTTVLLQGSGTFSVEAMLSATVPLDGKVLIVSNGAYGRRLEQIAKVNRIPFTVLNYLEDCPANAADVDAALRADPKLTHVAVVHCETTSGLLNPACEIGAIARRHGRVYCVDAMSSFGAVPLDLAEWGIDFLVSSANKCIEGVPGFGFVLARRASLEATAGFARSLSLDLHAQWRGLEMDGQFRFTPPTHALLAFQQALRELDDEGGVAGRAARYQRNFETIRAGMRALGFVEYLAPEHQGYIITSFRYPPHPNFNFAEFYERLNDKGYVIYPGKVSNADCFRIGHIGRLDANDMRDLVAAIGVTLNEMQIDLATVPDTR
jgi:2-aminoethylphosphonate-pyruvate transaminase